MFLSGLFKGLVAFGCVRIVSREQSSFVMSRPYQLIPIKLGCEVRGITLSGGLSDDVIAMIKKDVTQHRLLVFKNQEHLTPEQHLTVGRWFGDIESTFYNHPKSPHRDIFRVSNDRSEGCTNVGRTGWHIDGSFQEAPFSHSIYHIISVPTVSATVFAPLTDIVENLDPEKKALWDRLWMVSDRRSGPKHPMIYKHPESGKPVLCLHLGMTEGFLKDLGKKEQKYLTQEETEEVLNGIHHEFVKNDGAIQYKHKYDPGDLIVTDNLAVGHEASPDTQLSREKIGLRVMHRVTIAGKFSPKK